MCLLVEELTVLSPCGELSASLWIYWLPPRGDIGCLLTTSLWRTTVSSWRTTLFDRFPTLRSGFFRFSHGGLVGTFSLSSGLLEIFVVFWIVPLGPISIGGDDVTAGLCCRRYDQTLFIYKNLLWRFVFFVFMLGLVATFICWLIYRIWRRYSRTYIAYDLIMNCVCRRYNWTSSLLILLEESFYWILFFKQSYRCCLFTVCCDSPLPRDRNMPFIE